MDKKTPPEYMLPIRGTPQEKKTNKPYIGWRIKGCIKIFQENGQGKKAGIAILIPDKIDFKTKVIKWYTEGHFIIFKGIIPQQDRNIINIHAPNIWAPKYIRKILEDFKKDIDSNTLVLGVMKIPLSKMARSSKQNNNKDIMELNDALG